MALPPPTKYNTLFAVEACFFDVSLLGSTFPEGAGEGGDPIRQSIDLLVIEPNEANEHTTCGGMAEHVGMKPGNLRGTKPLLRVEYYRPHS